jgi:hypothetical protein
MGARGEAQKIVYWEWVKVRTPVRFRGKGKVQKCKDRTHNPPTKPASLPAAGRFTLTLRPTTFIF